MPRPCDVCKGGYDAADTLRFTVPSGPHRTYGASPALYHVLLLPPSAIPNSARARDRFLSVLEAGPVHLNVGCGKGFVPRGCGLGSFSKSHAVGIIVPALRKGGEERGTRSCGDVSGFKGRATRRSS